MQVDTVCEAVGSWMAGLLVEWGDELEVERRYETRLTALRAYEAAAAGSTSGDCLGLLVSQAQAV